MCADHACGRAPPLLQVRMLLAKIQPHMASLRSTLYGKRIQAKLARRFPQLRTAVG